MKKIPTLFQRNYDTDRLVRDEVVPGCEWVLAGEGIATKKFDGVGMMVRDQKLYKRFTVQLPGFAKKPQTRPDFEPATEPDPVTGKQEGWVPVGDGPEDRFMRDAFWNTRSVFDMPDGTYEFIGPKSQGNPEHEAEHKLVRHGMHHLVDAPRTFDRLRDYLRTAGIEGIVWHHPDGRMAKIKARDFGFRRK